jgi:hypothetical protein
LVANRRVRSDAGKHNHDRDRRGRIYRINLVRHLLGTTTESVLNLDKLLGSMTSR